MTVITNQTNQTNNTSIPSTYALDVTGVSPNNLIIGETQSATYYVFNYISYLFLNYLPFFGNSLVLQYSDGVNPQVILTEGIDYVLVLPFWLGTKVLGLPLYGGIRLLNNYCSGTFTAQYQTLGGQFQMNQADLLAYLESNNIDPLANTWDTISGDTVSFPYIEFGSYRDMANPATSLYQEMNNLNTIVSELNGENRKFSFDIKFTGLCSPNSTSPQPAIVIDAPVISLSVSGTSITATGSPFTLASGTDTEASATWQIATDSAFTNIVQSDINDTFNLLNYTFNNLSGGTIYYVRAMYVGVSGSSSPWSNPVNISTQMSVLGIGLFSGGFDWASYNWFSNTSIYTYSTNTAVAGSNLNASFNNPAGLSSSSNPSTAIIAGAGVGIYTYSNNVMSFSNSSLYTDTSGNQINYAAAAGNSNTAIFGGGFDNSIYSSISTTSVYTFSSDSNTVGSSLNNGGTTGLAAASNSTEVLFANGSNTSLVDISTTSIYTINSNSVVSGGNLSYACDGLAAAGNTTMAVFAGGGTSPSLSSSTVYTSVTLSTTSIYTYSNNTSISGTNIHNAVSYLAGISSGTVGVFGGGEDSNTISYSSTTVYEFSNNTVTSGGTLTYLAGEQTACGPTSGINA